MDKKQLLWVNTAPTRGFLLPTGLSADTNLGAVEFTAKIDGMSKQERAAPLPLSKSQTDDDIPDFTDPGKETGYVNV